ncbi:MAG TPA: hypothetical protein VF668_01285 [Pyrinomonadaceae bacterium]|jgi:hypothetical protein
MAEQRLRDSEVDRIGRELKAQGFTATDEERFSDCFVKYVKGVGPRERLTFLMRYGPGGQNTRIMFELHVAAENYYGTRQCDVETCSAVYEALALIKYTPDILALLRNYFADWLLAMKEADRRERRDSAPATSGALEGDGRREAA